MCRGALDPQCIYGILIKHLIALASGVLGQQGAVQGRSVSRQLLLHHVPGGSAAALSQHGQDIALCSPVVLSFFTK